MPEAKRRILMQARVRIAGYEHKKTKLKRSQIPLAVCVIARTFTFRDSKRPRLDPYFFVIL